MDSYSEFRLEAAWFVIRTPLKDGALKMLVCFRETSTRRDGARFSNQFQSAETPASLLIIGNRLQQM